VRVASGEIQIVAHMGRLFTAAETIHAEKEILRRMEQGQNRAAAIMPIHNAVAHSDKYQRLITAHRAPSTP
jgi:copper(I)-binding protein